MTQTAIEKAGSLEGAGESSTTDLLGIYEAVRRELSMLGDAVDAC